LIYLFPLYLSLIQNKITKLSPLQLAIFNRLSLKLKPNQCSGYYSLAEYSLYDITPYTSTSLALLHNVVPSFKWITETTLQDIKEHPAPVICWADGQLAARGQYKRAWTSAIGRQIQISLKIPTCWVAHISLTTLRIAPLFVLIDLITKLKDIENRSQIFFKWPNDCYTVNGKLAGFLIQQNKLETTISMGLNWSFSNNDAGIDSLYYQYAPSRLNFIKDWADGLLGFLLSMSASDQVEMIKVFINEKHLFRKGDLCQIYTSEKKILEQALFDHINANGQCVLYDCNKNTIILDHGFSLQLVNKKENIHMSEFVI